MSQQDYYQVLGVKRDADAQTIKVAYRELAFKYHPDRNKNDQNGAEMMKMVNEAYAVLSDPEKRRAYDGMRMRYGENAYGQFRSTYSEQDIFQGSDVNQVFEEMARAFGLRGVNSIFSDFYGPGYQRFTFNETGRHGRGFIYRGRFGKHRGKSMAGSVPPGVGRMARFLLQTITGLRLPQMGTDFREIITLTPEFARVGGPYAYHHRRRAKELLVNIPPGTKEGQQIRLSRMGSAGKNGGPDGDLYLTVKFKKPLLVKAKDFIVSVFGR